jgi:hypothetical protein
MSGWDPEDCDPEITPNDDPIEFDDDETRGTDEWILKFCYDDYPF